MKFYKSDKGYFYKIKNNGDKVRISQDMYNKNIKVGGGNTIATQSPLQLVTLNRDPLTKNKSILYYLGISLGKNFIVTTRQDIKNKVKNIPPFISGLFNVDMNLIMFVYKEQFKDGICIYQVNNTINIKRYIDTVSTSTSPTSTSPTSNLLSYSINLNTPLNSKLYNTTYNNKIKNISEKVNKLLSPNSVINTVTDNNYLQIKGKSILYYLGIALGKKYIVVTKQDIKNRDKENNKENNKENRSAAKFCFNREPNLIMIIYQKDITNGICIYQDSNNIIIKPYNVMKKQIKTFPLVQDINLSNTSYNINRSMSNSIINDISQEVKQLFSEINVSSALMIMPN